MRLESNTVDLDTVLLNEFHNGKSSLLLSRAVLQVI